MIGGVVFDKDGTLFDFRQSWGGWTQRLLQDLAVDADHAHRLAASISFDPETGQFGDDSPVIAATGEEIAAHLLPHLPGMALAALVARINLLAVEAEMAPAVPLDPLLTALRSRGLQLGVATNDIEAAARAHLATAGVSRAFRRHSRGQLRAWRKAGSGHVAGVRRATGLMPERVLMVGDSAHDLVAGRAAGMRPVAVLTGIARADELRRWRTWSCLTSGICRSGSTRSGRVGG